MGTIQHDCVIAVGTDLSKVRDWIATLPETQREVFFIDRTTHNPVDIIIMRPDGSQEGWAASDIFDQVRTGFINRLKRCHWVHVSFGELGVTVKSNV